ncbi:MAG: PAS domain S-box protein [Clostridia bacterium]|nr:PAS domain S-box protein [Clostridia bacterium]
MHYLQNELYELNQKDESLFNFIQEICLDGMWYWDLEQPENEWMNDKFWRVLGFDPEQMPHSPEAWQNIINQEDLKNAKVNIEKHLLNPGTLYDQVLRYKHCDGHTVWIRCFGQAILNEEKKPIRMLGVHTNITPFIEEKRYKATVEAKLSSLLSMMQDGYWLVNPQGILIDVNPSYCKMAGFSRDMLIGKHVSELQNNDDQESVRKRIQCAIENGKDHFYSKHRKINGTEFPCEVTISVLHMEEELFLVSHIRDMSQQLSYEEALNDANKRYEDNYNLFRGYIDQSPVAIFVLDLNGKCSYVNELWTEFSGINYYEAIGALWTDFIDLKDQEKIITKWQKHDHEDFILNDEFRFRKGNDVTWVEASVKKLRDEQGQPLAYLGSAININKRKQAENQLKLSRERLIQAQSLALMGPWELDHQSNQLTWSDQIYEIFDIPKADFDLTVENVEKMIHPEDYQRYKQEREASLKANDAISIDYRIITGNQGIRCVSEKAKTIRDIHDNPVVIIGTIQDITERKIVEAKLKEAMEAAKEANQYKSDFLANMSHEIRTPINGALGFLQILSESQITEEQKSYIYWIDTSLNRLLLLVNDILDMSKIESGRLELDLQPFNLSELVYNATGIFKAKSEMKGLNFIVENKLSHDVVLIGDSLKINQILSNIISNALKFTENGTISVTVDMIENEKSYLRFWIKDTGIGIKKENFKKIFSEFMQENISTTRTYGGTGLGLSITKKLLDLMGGKIELNSEVHKGSTFMITIPVRIQEKLAYRHTPNYVSVKEMTSNHKPAETRKHVLVVDDDDVNRLIIKKYLEKQGITYVEAKDGSEAVEFSKAEKFDFILMDCQMPIMDGFEATKIIRTNEYGHQIPIIAMTAYAFKSDKEKCLDAGMDYYLSKPFIFNDLDQLIKKIVSKT